MSLRSLFVLPFFVFFTLVFSLLAMGSSILDPSGNRSHRVASWWATLNLFLCGVRVKIINLEYVDPNAAYIVMANHQSIFDIPVLLSALPIQFRWLAKESLFKIPIFGWAMKRTGYIPINRSNSKQAYQSLLLAAKKVNEGASIIIFPEGTRQETDQLGDFKKGGFVLALKSQRPILPIGILGSRQVLPKNKFWITPGLVTLVIGKPIPTEGCKPKKEVEVLMQKVRDGIENALKS